MLILLHFHTFKTFFMLRSLSPKFNLSALGGSDEKKTPSAQISFCRQLKLNGVSCLSYQQPNHIASSTLYINSSCFCQRADHVLKK